jgi:hypothetical protein
MHYSRGVNLIMGEDRNFIGTYITENSTLAVVVAKSQMVVQGKKRIIWLGFLALGTEQKFQVWDNLGLAMGQDKDTRWNLKEVVREKAY